MMHFSIFFSGGCYMISGNIWELLDLAVFLVEDLDPDTNNAVYYFNPQGGLQYVYTYVLYHSIVY